MAEMAVLAVLADLADLGAHLYRASVRWRHTSGDFVGRTYDQAHEWAFDGGIVVPASPSPTIVPAPYGHEDAIDPEEAFVAAIASCHMLAFLGIAAKRRVAISSYEDEAFGELTANAEGRPWVSRVTLHPRLAFPGDRPAAEEIARLHHLAHRACFIANSVKTEIVVAGPSPDHSRENGR